MRLKEEAKYVVLTKTSVNELLLFFLDIYIQGIPELTVQTLKRGREY